VADVDGNGSPDVEVGAGPGAGPHLRAFGGSGLAVVTSRLEFAPTPLGGIFVA
jgi:hypothetical protein